MMLIFYPLLITSVQPFMYLRFPVLLLLIVVYLRLFLPGSIILHIFWALSMFLVALGIACLVGGALILFGRIVNITIAPVVWQGIIAGVSLIIIILTVRIIMRRRLFDDLPPTPSLRTFIILAGICIAVFIYFSGGASHYDLYLAYEGEFLVLSVITLFVALIGYGGFSLSLSLSQQSRRISELEQEARLQQMEQAYTTAFDEVYQELRVLHHDSRNHFISLRALADAGDVSDLKNYLSQMEAGATPHQDFVQSGSPTLDAILNTMLVHAQQAGIEVSVVASAPAVLPLNSSETVSLLGNLVDNAIEACERFSVQNEGEGEEGTEGTEGVPRPRLAIEVSTRKGQLVIKVENTALPPHKRGNSYRTVKQGRSHGLGVPQIDRLVRKYNGRVYRNYAETTPQYGTFSTTILIPLNDDTV
jgi:signal transduction histidine kinase